MKRPGWITHRRVLVAAIGLFWLAYFATFFMLRGHYVSTDIRFTKNGSMLFIDTPVYYFTQRPKLNSLCYWAYVPIHRVALRGRTVAEWEADVAAGSITPQAVYIEDVAKHLQEQPWLDKFFTH